MKALLSNMIGTKLFALLAVTLVLLLPLAQISGLIQERGASRLRAAQELATTHAGPQLVVGPVLVVPYVERWTEAELDDKGRVKSRAERTSNEVRLVFPERLEIGGQLAPQERYRGIFKILFYQFDGRYAGRFPAFDPASLPHREKNSTLEVQPPVLAMMMSDVRGIQGAPVLRLAGAEARFLSGVPGVANESWLQKGVHAPLNDAAKQAWRDKQPMPFNLQMVLVGQERLAIAPVADETVAHLDSTWQHPSFGGQFLATRRNVSDRGFDADWAVSSLVSSARGQVGASVDAKAPPPDLHTFNVTLADPVNVHSLSNRAVKYAELFIVLVLAAVFMFELFRKLRLHPVQYALVGASLALFFLLLLALSEKLPFWLAYAGAGGASVALLTVYFGAVLHGWWRGLSLGGYVGVLYAAMYGLLSSEDNALLLGSLLLFGLLSVLMLATRRVDWYALSARVEPVAA